MNALKFYQKMGYNHINGEFAIDDEDSYTLEKLRWVIGGFSAFCSFCIFSFSLQTMTVEDKNKEWKDDK